MSRVEENKEALEQIAKCVKEKENGTYEELVVWNLSVMNFILTDISKSMAVIADNMSHSTQIDLSESEEEAYSFMKKRRKRNEQS